MRFFGNIVAKLDAKNRVFIPAAFRKQLLQNEGQRLYLRKDVFQNCITVYTQEDWDGVLNHMETNMNMWEPLHRDLLRQFVLDAEEVTPDGSGRILISKQLLSLVGIESEVRFLGVDKTLEIWPKEALERPRIAPEEFGQKMRELLANQ